MKDIESIHQEEYDSSAERPDFFLVAQAPGRLHLLGEQGENGGGLLLSTAINRSVRLAVSSRHDNSLRFYAADLNERKRTTLINLKYKREDRWANFIKLAVYAFTERGYPVHGLNFTLSGDIPFQIALASSSAIEIAAAVALRDIYAPTTPSSELISMLGEASKTFFAHPESQVDFAIALGSRAQSFSIVDAQSIAVRQISSPLAGYRILLTDSRVPRLGIDSEIRQRQNDIRKGLELLSHKKQGATLRDFASEDLIESMGHLPEEIRRRTLHAVRESRRVLEAEEAFRRSDLAAFAKMVYHSHESLRDLFEVSCPEIDWLVKRSQEMDGVLCSRMTGLGFGGCTYTILAEGIVEEYKRRMDEYERIFGFKPIIHEVSGADAARVLTREETHAHSPD